MSRGAITRWQAKRLLIGDTGPFFVGDYRLLERHEREGDGLLFTARHEPSGRLVAVVVLSAKQCRERDKTQAQESSEQVHERISSPETALMASQNPYPQPCLGQRNLLP